MTMEPHSTRQQYRAILVGKTDRGRTNLAIEMVQRLEAIRDE